MKNKALVSVFMPAYQQECMISDSIESVLAQTYDNWELIIGDDCSSDQTYEKILEYRDKYPNKIKAFTNKENLGITENFNKILGECSGKYIAIMAGDDILLPDKLERQVTLMESNQDCVLSYHDVEVFDSVSNSKIRNWNSGSVSSPPVTGAAVDVAKMLVLRGTGFMSALSIMVRQESIQNLKFDFRIPIASDWLMWIEICANSNGSVYFLNDILARYRKHSSSITHITKDDITDQMVTLGIVEAKYPWLREVARRRRGYEYYHQGINLILMGKFEKGRSQLLMGMRTYIWSWKSIPWWLLSWYKQVSS